MRTAAALGGFGVVLAVALGVGAAAGSIAGPVDTAGEDAHSADAAIGVASDLPAGGLLVAQDGLRLAPLDRLADAGPFRFRIVDSHPRGTAGQGSAVPHLGSSSPVAYESKSTE